MTRTRRRAPLLALALALLTALPAGAPVAAQTPAPTTPAVPCGDLTAVRFPIHDPGAVLVTPFAFADPALPSPIAGAVGRFHPSETWAIPGAAGRRAVYPIGTGRILHTGTIGAGDRGGIVVVEHTGAFLLPGSEPGDPYLAGPTPATGFLSVYAGVDPVPYPVGTCVTPETLIGVTTEQCGTGVALPCSDLPAGLRLEIRLAATADPALRSIDWAVAGLPGDSVGGTFPDPQVMVNAGYRSPSRTLVALAPACPAPVTDPAASPAPCTPVLPSGTPVPLVTPAPTAAPTATPVPGPTTRPFRAPANVLYAGVPTVFRDLCQKRTSKLVTGTLAALDCTPAVPQIAKVSYFLGRPPDVRFTFNNRIPEHGLSLGGDCRAGFAGVESKTAELSSACYRNAAGRANLVIALAASCPGVYVHVEGATNSIAALANAWQELTGGVTWNTPIATVKACTAGLTGVSAPPAPTGAKYTWVSKPGPFSPYTVKVTVTWTIPVTTDTTIEVYGIDRCLAVDPLNPPSTDRACYRSGLRIPSGSLRLLRSGPAEPGKLVWQYPGLIYDFFPPGAVPLYVEEIDGEWYGANSILIRARNSRGSSYYVLPSGGAGEWIAADPGFP